MREKLVIIRGAGDLATGVAQSLYEAGFRLLLLEVERPSAIRRQVALCEAVYDGTATVENLTCRCCQSLAEAQAVWEADDIPLIVDPSGTSIATLKPWAVVDAILAKKNLGTSRQMAPHTVALGPGFTAGVDDKVKKGQPMAVLTKEAIPVGTTASASMGVPVPASLTGFVRGLIRDGYYVPQGFKMADIDPRDDERENCFTISDKARSLGGAVLTALLWMGRGDV